MNITEFLAQYNKYADFAHKCFKEYSHGWNGYPGIEHIDFTDKGIDITYSVYDDKENLFISWTLVEMGKSDLVCSQWVAADQAKRKEEEEKSKKEQESRDRAELKRLTEKFGHDLHRKQED